MEPAVASAQAARPTAAQGELLDWELFERTPLQHDPFDYIVVPGLIRADALPALIRDYPAIQGPANHPPERLSYGPSFAALLDQLRSPETRARFGAKFGLDLGDCETTITVRRYCEQTDGHIHTDHRTKLITVLFYFNEEWPHEGGRLRMLRSSTDIEDYAAEVVPLAGTMLAFRRSDNSFHGHKPFVGERRMVQMSWTRGGDVARFVSHLTKPVRRLLNMS